MQRDWHRNRSPRFKVERERGDLVEFERGGRWGERFYVSAIWPYQYAPYYEDEEICDVCDGKRQATARRSRLEFCFRHVWDEHPFYYTHYPNWWLVSVCWSCFNKLRHHVTRRVELEETDRLIRKAQREIASERKNRKDQNNGRVASVSG